MGRSGGGGSRSSGGGGSRSSGGRSGGSSSSGRSGRSSSSSSRVSRVGGSYSGTRGSGYRGIYGNNMGGYGKSKLSGCIVSIIKIYIVIFAICMLLPVMGSIGVSLDFSTITKSTISREALPKGSVNETNYYTDTLDWVKNPTKLTTGLKSFYKETGVQPHLYIIDNVGGDYYPSDDLMDKYANDLYSQLFTDEAHLLLVFQDYGGQYKSWYVNGVQAKTVIDQEASDILLDYIDKYYYSDMDEDELFSKAFNDAGERIMTVTKSPVANIITSIVILFIVLILFKWWKAHKAQKNRETEETERILNTPIEKLSSPSEAEMLADKYKE